MAFKGVGCDYQPEHTGHGTLCHSHSSWRCIPQVIKGWGCLLSVMRDPWKIEECESRQLCPCENVFSVCAGIASMSHSMCVLVGWGGVEDDFHWEYSDDKPKAKPHRIPRKKY